MPHSRPPLLACLAATLILATALPAHASDGNGLAADESTTQIVGRYAYAAQDLIKRGIEFLGIRYRFGGNSPETGLDCSGLVQNVFRSAIGLDLPRSAREMARLGERISFKELQPGDLVFFNTMRRAFSHVGIYMGEGRFLHAPASGGEVRIDEIGQRYWSKRFNGARRVLPEAEAAPTPPSPY